ncbi:MAG: T9SS type A sorting domain-containing protein [Bacteroidales bacterium]|nr:T9SS type A sorting domain-containing protein [Bacteroidales bacterium]
MKQYATSTGTTTDKQVVIYTQPTKEQVFIQNLPLGDQQIEIKIYNATGLLKLSKAVVGLNGEILVLDVSVLETGNYNMQMQTGNEVISDSFIQQLKYLVFVNSKTLPDNGYFITRTVQYG